VKIGILTNTYPPNLNGVSVSVESLEKNLKKLGHKVYLATPQIKGQKYKKNILPLRSTQIPKSISPDLKLPYFYINEVRKFFKEKEVEIIHTHDTILGGAEGALLAYQLDIPAVHTFHTMVEEYDYFKFPGYKKMIAGYIKEVCNQYDHIVAPSQKIYRYLLEKGVRVPISNLLNVPNILELESPVNKLKVDKIKKELKIDAETKVFITFCRIAKEKSVDLALNIFAQINKQKPNTRYIIAGLGPDLEPLKQQAIDLNIADKVYFHGKYKRTELSTLCSLATAFLFTSYTENLPTNIFEAMYFGVPILSVDDASVDYLLQDNLNGIKCSLEDLLKRSLSLIDDSKTLQKYSDEAKKSTIQINPEMIASEHSELYQKVIQNYQTKPVKDENQIQFLQLQNQEFIKFFTKQWQNTTQVYQKILDLFN
jgi:1,2-diacylglycerol 3-alpha-glucosyltransferase